MSTMPSPGGSQLPGTHAREAHLRLVAPSASDVTMVAPSVPTDPVRALGNLAMHPGVPAVSTRSTVDGALEFALARQPVRYTEVASLQRLAFRTCESEVPRARRFRSIMLHALVVGAALAVVASAVVPAPYVLSTPGRIVDADTLLEGSDVPSGLAFPTVVARPVPWLLLPYRLLRTEDATLTKIEFVDVEIEAGEQASDAEVRARTATNARAAALDAAGTAVRATGTGVLVTAASAWPGGPPAGAIIVSVDRTKVRTTADLRRVVLKHEPGDRVPVATVDGPAGTIWLRPHPATVEGWWIDEDMVTSKPKLSATRHELPEPAAPKGIHGDSHGLALALAYYAKLTGIDVTHGRKVVATGGIDSDGTVLPVGGVDLKTVAAHRDGADVVLVPRATYREAFRHQTDAWFTGPSIVPVDSLEHALDVLADPPPNAMPSSDEDA